MRKPIAIIRNGAYAQVQVDELAVGDLMFAVDISDLPKGLVHPDALDLETVIFTLKPVKDKAHVGRLKQQLGG